MRSHWPICTGDVNILCHSKIEYTSYHSVDPSTIWNEIQEMREYNFQFLKPTIKVKLSSITHTLMVCNYF